MLKSLKINNKFISSLFTAFFFVSFIVIICLCLEVYSVEGNSMNGTIEEGDHIVVNTISPKIINYSKGDVVIVKKHNQVFVKRLLAIEGELLLIDDEKIVIRNIIVPHDPVFNSYQIDLKKNELSCDKYFDLLNRSVNRSKTKFTSEVVTIEDNRCKVRVPQNYTFLVGDNYYESMDSRFWGFIHKNEILGKVILAF